MIVFPWWYVGKFPFYTLYFAHIWSLSLLCLSRCKVVIDSRILTEATLFRGRFSCLSFMLLLCPYLELPKRISTLVTSLWGSQHPFQFFRRTIALWAVNMVNIINISKIIKLKLSLDT